VPPAPAGTTRSESSATCSLASRRAGAPDLAVPCGSPSRVLRRRGIGGRHLDFQAEGYEKALGALRRRHDWWPFTCATRGGERVEAGGASWPSRTRRRGSGWWPDTGGRGAAGAAGPRFRGLADRLPEDAGRTRWPLDTGESYERPLSGFFKARERSGRWPPSPPCSSPWRGRVSVTATASKTE